MTEPVEFKLQDTQTNSINTERVLEIWFEIFGRIDDWVAESPIYRQKSEDELYTIFSELKAAEDYAARESLIWDQKPVILDQQTANAIYKEILGKEVEVSGWYLKMTEQELRNTLESRKSSLEGWEQWKKSNPFQSSPLANL